MADEERTEATTGEAAGESTQEQETVQAGAEHAETAAGGQDPRDEQLRLMREENERLRALAANASSTEGRAEASPTTHAPSYEQAFAAEAQDIANARQRLMEREATEGVTVESMREAQKLIERQQRLAVATTAHALKKTELNTFVATLPPKDQQAFRDFAASNGHRYADLEALFDGYEAKKLRAERTKTVAKTERAEAIIKRNDEGRIATVTREVTAAEAKEKRAKMTGKQFDAEYDRLIASGDNAGALRLSQRLNSGQLEVED